MMELEGVIDFDLVKCLILIEEKHFDSSGQSITTESSNVQTEAAEARSIAQDNQSDAHFYPTKFRIEVESCPTFFIFEAPNYVVLQKWMAAIYANWSAGNAVKEPHF